MKRRAVLSLAAVLLGTFGATFAQAADPAEPEKKAEAVPVAPAPVVDTTTAPVVSTGDAGRSGGGWHVTSEVGFYYLRPEWRTNPAYTVFTVNSQTTGAVGQSRIQTQNQNFSFDPQFVPRLSLGVAGDGGLGFRTNFWQFSDSSSRAIRNFSTTNEFTPATGFTATGIVSAAPLATSVVLSSTTSGTSTTNARFGAKLRMVVWDFEATDEIRAGRWRLTPAAGIRYAHISQDYAAASSSSVVPLGSGGLTGLTSVLRSGHNFNGAGPTVALDAQRQIGGSSFSLYATTRGSLLFGSAKQTVGASESVTFTGGFTDTFAQTNQDNSAFTTIPVLEVELGGRWERDWGRSRLYAQLGLVGQAWFGAGNSTRSSAGNPLLSAFGFFGPTGVGGLSTGSPVDHDLGLLGLSVQTGIQF